MNPNLVPFDPKIVTLIQRCMCTIENDNNKPEIQYAAVMHYHDGTWGGQRVDQYTLSIGFTETGGNLKKVLQKYIDNGGALAAQFTPYMLKLGHELIGRDKNFEDLLKRAAIEPAMQQAQQDGYAEYYLGPTFAWGKTHGFALPLSYLVLADSFLHSGSIQDFLRARFAEKTPDQGGSEKEWIKQYSQARHNWLANHSQQLLRNTAFRPQSWLNLIAQDNWNLDKLPIAIIDRPKVNYA